jgi:uncharacterized low-complexity protein
MALAPATALAAAAMLGLVIIVSVVASVVPAAARSRRDGYQQQLPKQHIDPSPCGPGVSNRANGRCPEGQCCSPAGTCGMTLDECRPNVNSAFNGEPSVWRCGRLDADRANARRPACASDQPPGGNLGCGPASNQFCPWTPHGSEQCCVRDGPSSLGGTCRPCAGLRPYEEAQQMWLYDAKRGWFK